MSVLDTLTIIYDSDTSQLKTGLRDVGRETEVLGKKVTNTDARLSRMIRRSISLLAVFGSLKSVFDYSEEIYSSSQALDVNIEKLGAWSGAIQTVGGKTEDFSQSIVGFAEKFNLSADEAIGKLPQLADQLSKLNSIEALKIGKELGFNEKTISLLRKGRAELENLIKLQYELGVVTKEDAEIIHKFSNQLERTGQVFRVFGTRALGDILPIVQKFFEYMQKGVGKINQYPYLIEGITIALTALSALLTIVAAKAVLAFLPFGVVSGIILGVGIAAILAYDDIKTFINGGDSLIGRAIEKWPGLVKVFDRISDSIQDAIDAMQYFIYLLQNGVRGALSFNEFKNLQFGPQKPTGAGQELSSEDELFFTDRQAYLKKHGYLSDVAKTQSAISQSSFVGPLTPSQTLQNFANRSTTINNTGDTVINTQATDAQSIYDVFKQSQETQIRQALDNSSSGVAY